MFLRPNRRMKDGKEHSYWSLVETVRTPDCTRQRTLCYLDELKFGAARWLKTMEAMSRASTTETFPVTDGAAGK
jgi:hypothetical protein